MTSDVWEQTQRIFARALELPPAERDHFLDEACAGAAGLRREVESLLAHDSRAGERFLEPPEFARPSAEAVDGMSAGVTEGALLAGQRMAGYEIEALIARGGMGDVYRGRQLHPARPVAIKVLRRHLGMASLQRRFEAEAEILGRLQHPHIARVYGAGVHQFDGLRLPYFAMEYIAGGRDLLDYATHHGLDLAQRIALFAKVCDAIHYGHQRGVIHRDIKPANILVDEAGEPKVIDFGIARVTDADVLATTQHTAAGQLIGTIQYMSPEQCDADAGEIDTRSDVYSLGVVLYELLLGELPYRAHDTTIVRATHAIRTQAPRRPGVIQPRLRGDLETVMLKALEKDRGRRYASAAALADDLRHVLRCEPISARPPSATYLLRKFVQRHPWRTAATAASVLLVVAASIVLSTWSWATEAEEQRQRAQGLAAQAQVSAAEAQQARELAEITAYGARVSAAESAWINNSPSLARAILREVEARFPERLGWEWHHLHERFERYASASIIQTAEHGAPILHAAVCHDRFVPFVHLSEGSDSTVGEDDHPVAHLYFHDLRTGADWPALALSALDRVNLAVTRDGTVVIAARSAQQNTDVMQYSVQIWQVSTQGEVTHITDGSMAASQCHTITAQPGSPWLFSGHQAQRARAWRYDGSRETGSAIEPQGSAPAPAVPIQMLCTSRGDLCICTFSDRTLGVWNTEHLRAPGHGDALVARLAGHANHVIRVAVSADDRWLASTSADRTVRIWDLQAIRTGMAARAQQPFAGQPYEVARIELKEMLPARAAFAPWGPYLAIGDNEGGIQIWRLSRGTAPEVRPEDFDPVLVNRLQAHSAAIAGLDFVTDGRLVSWDQDGCVRSWWPFAPSVPTLPGHLSSVHSPTFTHGGRRLVTVAGGNSSIILWDTRTCTPLDQAYLWPTEFVAQLVVAQPAAGREFVITATHRDRQFEGEERRAGGRIVIHDTRDDDLRQVADLPVKPGTQFLGMAASADGRRFAVGDRDGVLHVWALDEEGDASWIADIHCGPAMIQDAVFLDPAGEWIAVGFSTLDPEPLTGPTLALVNVDTRSVRPLHASQSRSVSDLAISPDGQWVASASREPSTWLWSVQWDGRTPRLEVRHRLDTGRGVPHAVAFSPDGQRLATGGNDRVITLYDVVTGIQIATLHDHRGPVAGLGFDSTSRRLASTSSGFWGADNVARIWDHGLTDEQYRERCIQMQAYRTVLALLYSRGFATPALARQALESEVAAPPAVREAALASFDRYLPHARTLLSQTDDLLAADSTDVQLRDAGEWIAYLLARYPEYPPVREAAAYRALRLGDARAALEHLAPISAERLNSPLTYALLTLAYEELDDTEAADAARKRTAALLPGLDGEWQGRYPGWASAVVRQVAEGGPP